MTFCEILLKIAVQWSEPHQTFRRLPASHPAVGRKQIDALLTDEDKQVLSSGDFPYLFQLGTENSEKIQK